MPNLNQYDKDRIKNLIIKKDLKSYFQLIKEIFNIDEWGLIEVNKICYIVKQLVKLKGLDTNLIQRQLQQISYLSGTPSQSFQDMVGNILPTNNCNQVQQSLLYSTYQIRLRGNHKERPSNQREFSTLKELIVFSRYFSSKSQHIKQERKQEIDI